MLPRVANVFSIVSKKDQGISRPREIMTSVSEADIVWGERDQFTRV